MTALKSDVSSIAVREPITPFLWASAADDFEPRQRAANHGAHTLSDRDAIAAMVAGQDPAQAAMFADQLIAQFGNYPRVLAASHAALAQIVPLSIATDLKLAGDTARRLLAAEFQEQDLLNSVSAVSKYLRATMAGRTTEAFRVLWLNTANRLIADEILWEGTQNHAPVLPPAILRRALEMSASSMLIAHCHPSGSPDPSHADIEMTRKIIVGAEAIGLKVHDHFIVAHDQVTSMKAKGFI